MSNHPNRGRGAKLLARVVSDLRVCAANGFDRRIELYPQECAVIIEQLDRIPQLEIAARTNNRSTTP